MKMTELPADRQFFSSRQLKDLGYSPYLVCRMEENGLLQRLNRSMYENVGYTGETSDFAYLNAVAPQGVVCMMTAARFYRLTNDLPDTIDIAIGNSMKISTLPEWPVFHIYYFSKARYEIGITTANDGTVDFKIYDMEKTVVDILGYRNKIGIEETKNVLRSYLACPDRNLNRLHRYASELGAGTILRTYLEVLL